MQHEEDSLSGQRLSKDHSWIIAENSLSLGVKKPYNVAVVGSSNRTVNTKMGHWAQNEGSAIVPSSLTWTL